jgi:hypothetical protein
MTNSSIVLVIPFEMKEEAKLRKCSWDKENKYWFISSDRYNEDEKFFEAYKRVDLISSYKNKDKIKNNGGKWDPENKVWYTYKANENLQDFMKFKDKNEAEKEKITKKEKAEKEEHDKIKNDYIKNGGNEEDFGRWYSVNILNHE